jgi:hypothetical protein
MEIKVGEITYEWIEDWAKIPASESSRTGWAHNGLAVSKIGEVFTFHPAEPCVLVFDEDGESLGSMPVDLIEGHGITLVEEDGEEFLWIADIGKKRQPSLNYEYLPDGALRPGQVVKMDLSGRISQRIQAPPDEGYRKVRYSPTSVAVDEKRFGGNGDIFVADGYGLSRVHRFDKEGTYLNTIDGREGAAGKFETPHAVFVDRRRGEPELYIADRGNKRVQVYGIDGKFRRVFGAGFLTSPSAFAVVGDLLVIAELRARLTVVDGSDNLLCYMGNNEVVCETGGWPNRRSPEGAVLPPALLASGRFNSPHGLAADSSGNLYVSEWLIGGRIVKLLRT